MELKISDLIEYHRRKSLESKPGAVGWGGAAPGSFEQREAYRFHCDAVETLEEFQSVILEILEGAENE